MKYTHLVIILSTIFFLHLETTKQNDRFKRGHSSGKCQRCLNIIIIIFEYWRDWFAFGQFNKTWNKIMDKKQIESIKDRFLMASIKTVIYNIFSLSAKAIFGSNRVYLFGFYVNLVHVCSI